MQGYWQRVGAEHARRSVGAVPLPGGDSLWLLPFQSSSGSGALQPMERTTTFEYNVREIQTVGVGG